MSQRIDHRSLAADFPEHQDAIHRLKRDNAHFARLNDEYETLDKAIVRAEQGVDHLNDQQLEALKFKRVTLKDQLYQMLAS